MYLGEVISKEGIHIDPNKVITIWEWPTQKTVRNVQNFIGLA